MIRVKFESLISEYSRLKFKIRRTEIKEQELRALEGFPGSSGIEGMPRAKSNTSSVENSVVRLTEIFNERKRLEEELEAVRQRVLAAIDMVSSLMAQEIIETKIFIPNCGWKFVSRKVGLSESHCRHLFREGVEEINKRLVDKQ